MHTSQETWTVLSRFDVAEWKNLFKTPLIPFQSQTPLILFKLISNTLPILFISPSASLLLTIDENLRCESLMATVVMFRLWPEARSRAKTGQKKPGQAKPTVLAFFGFWPGLKFYKPKPASSQHQAWQPKS